MYTSHAFSPVVDGNTVIFHVGGHDKGALTAFDVTTGDVRWSWSGRRPRLRLADRGDDRRDPAGRRPSRRRRWSASTPNGALLWERPFVVTSTTNSHTPIVMGRTSSLAATAADRGVRAGPQGATWGATKLWENADVTMRMSNGVIVRDMLFGLSTRNMGQYFAIDAKTGKTLWMSEARQAAQAAIRTSGDLCSASKTTASWSFRA